MDQKSLLASLAQQQGGQGLLGGDWKSSIGPLLMALGGGIAGNSTQGWGASIGAGLQGASTAMQNQQESQLNRALLGLKFQEANKPDVKDITLPNGNKISVKEKPEEIAGLITDFKAGIIARSAQIKP